MRLTRTAFRQIMALKDQNLEELPDHLQKAVITKLQYILDQHHNISEIEGVKHLSGAKYLLQQQVIGALERLGETVGELQRDELAIGSFLQGESLVG